MKKSFYRPRKQNLVLQVILLYALLVVPLILALLAFSTTITRQVQADVQANDLALTNALSSEISFVLSDTLQMVENLSRYDAVRRADPQDMRPLFETVASARPGINLIYRLDANGIMVYHFPVGISPTIGESFAFRDYFQRARSSRFPLISYGRISPTTGEAVSTAVMPIWTTENQFDGVIAANLRLTDFSQSVKSIAEKYPPESGFQIYVLDAQGQIIAAPNTELLLQPAATVLPDVYQPVLFGKSGSTIATSVDGVERLYTYAPVNRAGWGVIISRPVSVAYRTAITIRQLSIAAILTFITVGIAFWLFLNRRVILPIEQLALASNLLGTEEPLPDEMVRQLETYASTPDQIGTLIKSLLRAERNLTARAHEQAMLLETSRAVVSSLDIDTVLNLILEQVQKLMNVEMCAIIARDEHSDRFHIRASRGLSAQFSQQLEISPNEPDSPTMRALKSRQPIQVSDTETDPSYVQRRPRARAEGFRSLLAIPMETRYTPPSALLVFRPEPHVFTPSEIRLLASFATQAAMALENAALYARSDARLQEQTRRLEALAGSLDDALILGDWRGQVIYANRRACQLADLYPEDAVTSTLDNMLHRIIRKSDDPGETRLKISEALKRYSNHQAEFSIRLNGQVRYLHLQVFEATDLHNFPIGQGILIRDVTTQHEVDRLKSNLISTVSHELRTPLSAIKGYASTLLAEDVIWDPASQKEFLRIILQEADRLNDLVGNLLDLSRLEAGRLRLQLQELDVRAIIQKAFQNASKEPEASLEIEIAPDVPTVYADPLRLETILRNLIENGTKYAGPMAHIRVSVERAGANILFRVTDNGPGIPPDEMAHIFKEFYRIPSKHGTRGTGLGLTICEGLVRAHNGKIWVEPSAQGGCFAFTIPAKPEEKHHDNHPGR